MTQEKNCQEIFARVLCEDQNTRPFVTRPHNRPPPPLKKKD